jgi:hypothetical protein
VVGVVLGEYGVHFLAVGMLLCGLDGFGVFGLDGLYAVVVVFECGDHFSDGLDVLNKLIIDTLILLLVDIVLVRIGLLVEFLVGHGLVSHVEVLEMRLGLLFLARAGGRSFVLGGRDELKYKKRCLKTII